MGGAALTPRKTPAQARGQATFDAILEAAAQLIGRDGLDGFNTNAVAERAGVSIGSLYQYFPGKDAIMAALIRRTQAERQSRLRAALTQPHADIRAHIRALVRAAMMDNRDNAMLAAAIDHEEARLPLQAEIAADLNLAGMALRGFFDAYPDQLADVDRDRAAGTLPALVRAVVDSWANRSPPQPDIAEDEAVRAVCGYLGLTQARPCP